MILKILNYKGSLRDKIPDMGIASRRQPTDHRLRMLLKKQEENLS